MRQGFVKAAAVTPKIKVADTKYNAELILDMMKTSINGQEAISMTV